MESFRILLYHSIGRVDPRDDLGIRIDKDEFRSQMEFLKKNYNVILLKDVIDCIKEKRPILQKTIIITFDDGYKDNILNALPIMEEFDFQATFFITFDYIGGVKTNPKREWQYWKCMDRDDLRYLIDRGHDIGSHGYRHISLEEFTKDAKRDEVRLSKQDLGSLLNKDIEFFSYPYGYLDELLIDILKDEGYKAACTTAMGKNSNLVDLYKLKRIEIVSKDDKEGFRQKLEYEG